MLEEPYTVQDGLNLNTLKNRIRACTRFLDGLKKDYPDTIEVSQVKHEVSIFAAELDTHTLLPDDVSIYKAERKRERKETDE